MQSVKSKILKLERNWKKGTLIRLKHVDDKENMLRIWGKIAKKRDNNIDHFQNMDVDQNTANEEYLNVNKASMNVNENKESRVEGTDFPEEKRKRDELNY